MNTQLAKMPKTAQHRTEKTLSKKDNDVCDNQTEKVEREDNENKEDEDLIKAMGKAPVRPMSTSEPTDCIDVLTGFIKSDLSHGFSVKDDIASLLDIMEQHETNTEVQAKACQVLSDLTSVYINEETNRAVACKTIIEQGGIARIIKAMELHSKHDGIQQTCCDSLYELGGKNRDTCDQIVAKDGIPSLVRAIRQHENNSHVQYKGMRALSILIDVNYKITELILNDGVIELTMASLKKHTDCADVQVWGMALLRDFACTFFHRLLFYVVTRGGIDCVLSAMRQHESDGNVQLFACSMLSTLSDEASACAFIVAAGGVECAINAMEQHPEIPWVQSGGRDFLALAGRAGEPEFSMTAAAA